MVRSFFNYNVRFIHKKKQNKWRVIVCARVERAHILFGCRGIALGACWSELGNLQPPAGAIRSGGISGSWWSVTWHQSSLKSALDIERAAHQTIASGCLPRSERKGKSHRCMTAVVRRKVRMREEWMPATAAATGFVWRWVSRQRRKAETRLWCRAAVVHVSPQRDTSAQPRLDCVCTEKRTLKSRETSANLECKIKINENKL